MPEENQKCIFSTYGCILGYTCDKVINSCRVPQLNEICLPKNLGSFGCDPGYVCKDTVCALPEERDVCSPVVGCKFGFTCDEYTNLCRRPTEAEACSPTGINSNDGCADGLLCTNYDLLGRWQRNSGTVLVKYFDMLTNASSIPEFDSLSPSFTTYAEKIDFTSGSKYSGVVFEANLKFPTNGSWSLNIYSSDMMYDLFVSNSSLILNKGNLLRTVSLIYITQPNETLKIRLECLAKSYENSLLFLKWSSPSGQESWVPSIQWELDKQFLCKKPLGQEYWVPNNRRELSLGFSCNPNIGCDDGFFCRNYACMVRLFLMKRLYLFYVNCFG